jgi:hypothetical protein
MPLDFTKSVDDMIAHDFSFDALRELGDAGACEIKGPKLPRSEAGTGSDTWSILTGDLSVPEP